MYKHVRANRPQDKAEQYVRRAAAAGGQIVVLPELFESMYFPMVHSEVRGGALE